ncbi:helix-turn-helix domain-containing protein [Streptomyces lavendulae]|uniref:AraC-like ligand-binding domain-containing protein n=1 Tax=Streptomyces lavendulae TaxID=1914 RepID=UPI0024A56F9F|nr:helix-turn-helix domain-containing protein [Streptomyces lavendulae]GLX18804.1 AraC family transcriptional regulator [Streptomyces lavendulae subsp. lavendulae]GLX29274.1 AraC family transcriptional regulator [Streptomyces lavendulae subsp. lavendulae]
MATLVASDAVGTHGDRFDWFCEAVSSRVMPVLLSSRHAADFRAAITELDLGVVRLSAVTCSPVGSRRTMTHVRRGDPEHLQLALLTGGAVRISQRGNESVVSGALVLTDTSRPSEAASADETLASVVVQIPRQALALGSDRLDGLLARNLPAGTGSGAVLAGFMTSLLAEAPHCRPEELPGLGAVTLDLATAFLARQLGDPGATPAEARARETLQRIHRFVENNLGDPDLTPRAVADRHNISLRQLHALFADQPLTIAAHIRRARLERARTDLARAEFGGHPVQAIAARWGFASATGFSRAFREAYGLTPTEHRALSLGAAQRAEHRNPARTEHHRATPARGFTSG